MSVNQDYAAGGSAPPPEGMPPEGAPPEAGPTPEGNMAAMEDERMRQMEAIAQAAPAPEKPYSTKLLSGLSDAINGLVSAIDPNMEQIEFVAEGGKWDQPLPPEIYVPLVLVVTFVSNLGEYDKYIMDPQEIVNDAAVRKMTGLLGMMKKDKDLIAQMQEPMGEEEEEAPAEGEAPPAGTEGEGAEMTEDDEALMAEM